MNGFAYAEGRPLSLVDIQGKDALQIVYPGFRVDTEIESIGRVPLFHAAVIGLNQDTGLTKYYEYGRYDTARKGIVRLGSVPNVVIDKKTKLPTTTSLNTLFKTASTKYGKNNAISFTYYQGGNINNVINYAESVKNNPDRPDYNIIFNNCYTFANTAASKGGTYLKSGSWDGKSIKW